MSSDTAVAAVAVEGLGKRYRVRQTAEHGPLYETMRDRIADRLRGRRKPHSPMVDFWALRGVDFRIAPGEAIGLIGRNGAGKSTLLKMLGRITAPTEGRIRLRGRVGCLLEVGTGFHPELTGRENVFLSGAILGMSRAEVRRRFDDIVAFAEVEPFLETPTKRYSSGMALRLAFAVAAHLDPEILLVDEVLAVGDAKFQRKCMGKMDEVTRGGGRTVIFVSHNLSAVSELCTRGIVLDRGRLVLDAPVRDSIAHYLGNVGANRYEAAGPSAMPHIVSASIDDAALAHGDLRIVVEWESAEPVLAEITATIANALGAPLFASNVRMHPGDGVAAKPARRARAVLEVPALPLHSGTYRLSLSLQDGPHTTFDRRVDAISFDFVSPRFYPDLPPVETIGPLQVQARWQWEGD